jgi:S1-C subfamily serine protease
LRKKMLGCWKQNRKLTAKEVAVSDKHDLLLLKINGYVTPFIRPGNANQLAHGQTLYAIGNPLNFAQNTSPVEQN